MVQYLFTDARSRAVFPGWDRLADEQVAHLATGPRCTILMSPSWPTS
jgi:hypothetical protein